LPLCGITFWEGVETFEKILVPLDGSPLAQAILPYVMLVAKGFRSHVILFHVAETALDHEDPDQKAHADETVERIRPLAENYLAGVADEFRGEGIDVETKVAKGRAAAQIVEYAEQEDVRLIAMSTHGRSGLARLVMGSTVDRTLRACARPVLLVRPCDEGASGEAARRFSKIIVPLDGSNAAEAALPIAEELAKALGLEIILIQVIGIEIPVAFGAVTPDSWPVPTHLLERLDVVASGYLTGLANMLKNKGLTVQWDVLRGAAGPRVVEFAKEAPDSLVAMTTHGRSGFRRWVLGSVADEVMRKGGEPVLVICPQAAQQLSESA
jgi:nucleotide-binding universal stress UspA family protein